MRGQKPPARPLGELLTIEPNPVRVPDPPQTLPEGLPRECWNEVVRELLRKQTYDTDIRDVVEAYCIQRARFIEANDKVQELGLLTKKKTAQGKTVLRTNPYVSISNNAYDRMVRMAQELGLTAVRRGSVKGGVVAAAGASKFLSRDR